ncbi:MAG: cell envelope integrity protein TolA [Lentisphaerae bacterium]|nr:cell envelope integrity protein TolA [Lentisphaerota bacterium]
MFRRFSRRTTLLSVIAALHVLIIFGPVGCYWLHQDEEKNKDIAFKVQLGGLEPSHAPEVGPPERLRPAPGEVNVPPPPPPPDTKELENQLRQEAALKAAREKAAREKAAREKAAREKAAREKAVREKAAREKAAREKAVREKARIEAEKKQKAEARKKWLEKQKKLAQEKAAKAAREKARIEAERKRREQQSVYQDPRWKNWDPNKAAAAPGGSNFNRNVKIGNKDTGQKYGKQDNRTPAGGANAASEAAWKQYDGRLKAIIFDKWQRPAGIWIDEQTAAVISILLDKNGRVIGKKVEKNSPNAAVNDSARRLLRDLNQLPKPPGNSTSPWLQFVLIPE